MTKKKARKLYFLKMMELAHYRFLGYEYNICVIECELNALKKLI